MDVESFKQQFLPLHHKLYAVAYRLLENAADAEDVVQEAYLKLWKKREGLTLVDNPEAFSVALVRNLCLDLLRSGRFVLNRQTVELSEVRETMPADSLEVKDEARYVRQLIARLPDGQRRVMSLRDVKGCSFEEIERLTGLGATNIRVLLSRARKKIREEFNKMEQL